MKICFVRGFYQLYIYYAKNVLKCVVLPSVWILHCWIIRKLPFSCIYDKCPSYPQCPSLPTFPYTIMSTCKILTSSYVTLEIFQNSWNFHIEKILRVWSLSTINFTPYMDDTSLNFMLLLLYYFFKYFIKVVNFKRITILMKICSSL